MRQHRQWLSLVLICAVVGACTVKVTPTGPKPGARTASARPSLPPGLEEPDADAVDTRGQVSEVISGNTAQLVGKVKAPAGVLSNNSGSLISDRGAGYRVKALEEQPLANAEVYLGDAAGTPLPGLAPVRTDAQGAYRLSKVPPDQTFVVVARVKTAAGKPAMLQTLVHTTALGATADLSVPTTLVTAVVVDGANGQLGQFNPVTYKAAVDATSQEAKADDLPDLADRAAILAWMKRLEQRLAVIEDALNELKRDVADIKTSLDEIKEQLNKSPVPVVTPTPVPGASVAPSPSPTPPAVVAMIAGGAFAGFQDGPASAAQFYKPVGVATDKTGNLFITDFWNHAIRKLGTDGQVTTIAGFLGAGGDDGPVASAGLYFPNGIAVGPDDTIYFADHGTCRIRTIKNGVVATLAGTGEVGYQDGPGAQAKFFRPCGIALAPNGTLYVAEWEAHRIRAVAADGTVSTLAGDGTAGLEDGKGTAARFNKPYGICFDAKTNTLLVGESLNNTVRRVTLDGTVTTVAGDAAAGYIDANGRAARFKGPIGVCTDADGNIYVSDSNNARIRRIAPDGEVTTVIGNGTSGFVDGAAPDAVLGAPYLSLIDAKGYLVFADYPNNRIRRVRLKP